MPCLLLAQSTMNVVLPAHQNNSANVTPLQIPDVKTLLRGELHLQKGRLLHTYIAAQGWEQDTQLCNHVLSMYGRCGAFADASTVFDNLLIRDIVSWNSMISVCAQNGYGEDACLLFEDMKLKGMEPDPKTFISILQICEGPEDLSHGEWLHAHTVKHGFESDEVVSTALLYMYGKCGALASAYMLFQNLHTYETIPWNVMITVLHKQGYDAEALEYFNEMLHHDVEPDVVTFVPVISACASLGSLGEGQSVHAMIQWLGYESEVTVGNALITMYGKCMAIAESRAVFDQLQHRDLSSWNAMLSAYNQAWDCANAMSIFDCMQKENIELDKITYVSMMFTCEILGDIEKVNDVHVCSIKDGFELETDVRNGLLKVYNQLEAFESASFLFHRMPDHNLVSWNTMISIQAQQGCVKHVITLITESQQKCIKLDHISFVCAFPSCCGAAALDGGRTLHAHTIEMGFECETIVGNSLISMYGRCEALDDARVVFDKIVSPNVVSWNAMMDAHVQLGQGIEVLQIFRHMQAKEYKADERTYVSTICGCTSQASISEGHFVHMHLVESGLNSEAIESALIIMYAKCGKLEDAELMFNRMDQGNVVGWNTIFSAYSAQDCWKEALVLFRKMQELGATPNKVTCVSILSVCGHLNALEDAQEIHRQVALSGLESDLLVGTALMAAYGDCGALDDAHKVFDRVQEPDVIAWNVLISIYGQQGHGKKALEVFHEMVSEHVKPSDVTFLNVLSSCSHAGLLEEGQKLFLSMSKEYGIKPTAEIYACMVDLLGRAGQLGKAEDLISAESLQQDGLLWANLLGACKLHGDTERGKRAAESIVDVEAQKSSTYVLLANMCTSQGQ